MTGPVTRKAGRFIIEAEDERISVNQEFTDQVFGKGSEVLTEGLLDQLLRLTARNGKVEPKAGEFLIALVAGINPQDDVERMMAVQMAATHRLVMTLANRLEKAENLPQQDSAERAFNKLARSFAAQVDTLKRYRTGGQQHVVVEHVTVNEGGQAIVGNVETGRGLK